VGARDTGENARIVIPAGTMEVMTQNWFVFTVQTQADTERLLHIGKSKLALSA
jgi:hypothetical protein